MAYKVSNTKNITVNQALHGYAHGHQQLASSTSLKARDSKTMLVLSDISGPGVQIGPEGYLTGYPLPESKAYVLAKTWLAPEMPRPGCVWTHSLIVDFSDLPTLENPSSLLAQFRRPDGRAPTEYGRKLVFRANSSDEPADIWSDFGKRLLMGLYDHPRSRIIGYRPPTIDIEATVVALWGQQWPRLRRNFRFCTLSGADRASDGIGFDLQFFSPNERGVRSRVQHVVDLQDVCLDNSEWLEAAYTDLVRPDTHQLRSFMRRMGADIDAGREAFRALCRLHVYIGGNFTSLTDAHHAIDVVSSEFSAGNAGLARTLISSRILEYGLFDEKTSGFLVENFEEILKQNPFVASPQLGAILWKQQPNDFVRYLERARTENVLSTSLWSAIPNEDVLFALRKNPDLVGVVTQWHQEFIKSREFLNFLVDLDDAHVLSVLNHVMSKTGSGILGEILPNSLLGRRRVVIDLVVGKLGRVYILETLSQLHTKGLVADNDAHPWIEACATNLGDLAKFLAEVRAVSLSFLELVSLHISPDDVPNDYGDDPWLLAVRNAMPPSMDAEQNIFLRCFLLARSLGYRSRSQAELAQFSFEVLYKTLASERAPVSGWRLIEPRLPGVFAWLYWDRCERLLDAVSQLFVDRNLDASVYARICGSDRLFDALARITARSYRGRQYLGHVSFELDQLGSEFAGRHRTALKLAAGTDRDGR